MHRNGIAPRARALLTGLVLLAAVGAAAAVLTLAGGPLARLRLVQERLAEVGTISGARLRLQQRAFELLPARLPGDNLLVDDIRLQLVQARQLGARLPPDALQAIDQLSIELSLPFVSRTDLRDAALLLEDIVRAETEAQERILSDAIDDVDTQRAALLIGIVISAGLLILVIWRAPARWTALLRPLMGFWIRGMVVRRRDALRLERMALAGEAAASLAHELRNPLAGVVAGLQNLERDEEAMAPRIRPLVEALERVSRTLNEHLGALRGPAEEESKVEVARVLADLGELLRFEAASGIAVETGAPDGLTCRTKRDRLHQVLLNLGLNALQAVEATGGVVRIDASGADGGLSITVRDSGPGFPEAVLQGVQPPFASSKPGGSGLGLRIVRRGVGELGGTMKLSNPEEGGALVELRIPCRDDDGTGRP